MRHVFISSCRDILSCHLHDCMFSLRLHVIHTLGDLFKYNYIECRCPWHLGGPSRVSTWSPPHSQNSYLGRTNSFPVSEMSASLAAAGFRCRLAADAERKRQRRNDRGGKRQGTDVTQTIKPSDFPDKGGRGGGGAPHPSPLSGVFAGGPKTSFRSLR